MNRSWKISMLCVSASTLLALPALGQTSVSSRLNRVPQSSSANSQLKRTVTDEAAAAAAAAASQVAGKFSVRFTVHLATAVPSGSDVVCGLSASVTDINTTAGTINNEIEEQTSMPATVSGTSATCNVVLPYSWYLANASNDTVDLTYTLQIVNPTNGLYSRYSTQFVPGAASMKVPANGVSTFLSVSATI